MVVIGIISLLATMIVPALRNLMPRSERKQFIADLNGLTAFAWRNALVTNKIHIISFNGRNVSVSAVAPGETEKDALGQPKSSPVRVPYLKSSLVMPNSLEIQQFIIEGIDEMANKERKTFKAWFFIMPNGLTQEITINLVDKKDRVAAGARRVGLVLNPFTAQFAVYDEFKK